MITQDKLIKHIDDVLHDYDEHLDRIGSGDPRKLPRLTLYELVARLSSTIEALTPNGHRYRKMSAVLLKEKGNDDPFNPEALVGILQALRLDLKQGHLQRWEELIRQDLFDSVIGSAGYLLSEGHKDAAATIAGGALEAHLRKLCLKSGMSLPKPGEKPILLSGMIRELCKRRVVGSLDEKNLRAWNLLRNQAAHASYDQFTKEQVELMIRGIQGFIAQFPA